MLVNIAALSEFSVPGVEHPRRPSGTSRGAAEEATQTTSAARLLTSRRLRIYFPSLYLNGVKKFIVISTKPEILPRPSRFVQNHKAFFTPCNVQEYSFLNVV